MNIESIHIVSLSSEREILFCSHCLPDSRNWNEYQNRVIKLIPRFDESCLPFMIHDDIVIGFGSVGKIAIIITAATTSNFIVESAMRAAIKQIEEIIRYICKEEIAPANLLERNHYIQLQIILQHEFTANGHMNFLSKEDFENLALFWFDMRWTQQICKINIIF